MRAFMPFTAQALDTSSSQIAQPSREAGSGRGEPLHPQANRFSTLIRVLMHGEWPRYVLVVFADQMVVHDEQMLEQHVWVRALCISYQVIEGQRHCIHRFRAGRIFMCFYDGYPIIPHWRFGHHASQAGVRSVVAVVVSRSTLCEEHVTDPRTAGRVEYKA